MPLFVYVKNSFGSLSCEIHYEETTTGAGVKKETSVLQSNVISMSEAMQGTKYLQAKYPFTGKMQED